MQYIIQSIASKRYVKLVDNKEIDKLDLTWKVSEYTLYPTYESAERSIRLYNLENVEIITIFPRTIDNSITRTDRNLEFVNELQRKAKLFKMESVGIKSLDNLVVSDYMYKARKHTSERELYCKLPKLNDWYIIQYHITSPGRIAISNYFRSKVSPETTDKVATVKINYDNVVEKITITDLKNIDAKKHDRADTLIVDNPHVFNKRVSIDVDHQIVQHQKSSGSNQSGINSFNKYQTRLVNIDKSWYEISYMHTGISRVYVCGYKKTDKIPEPLQKIVFIERGEQGIFRLTVSLYGAKNKYVNSQFKQIEVESKDYIIENPHDIL